MDFARTALRHATAEEHERTEQSFAGIDLGSSSAYGEYLLAHARAFPAIGAALSAQIDWPPWTLRWRDLRADLSELGFKPPPQIPLTAAASDAEAWGMAYVLEGSRLGSTLLVRQAPSGQPRAYLAGGLDREPWLHLQSAIETARQRGGSEWLAVAAQGARAAFETFRRAAAEQFGVVA